MPEIQNPNIQAQGPGGGSGGGDMRSTIIFTLLILAGLLGYQYFVKPATPVQPPQQQAAQQGQQTSAQSSAAQTMVQPAATGTAAVPAVSAALETDTTVENELYKIDFTNRGGRVKHWILKHYVDTAGKPLDMVQPQASQKFGYPLSLFTYPNGPVSSSQLNNALYQVTVNGAPPSSTSPLLAPTSITFHYASAGLDVVKTFSFDSTFVVTADVEVKLNGTPVRALVEWPAGLGDMEEFLTSSPSSALKSSNSNQIRTSVASLIAWSSNGKQDSTVAKKVSGNATFTQPYSYAAISDLYFAAAFLPSNPDQATMVTLHNFIMVPRYPERSQQRQDSGRRNRSCCRRHQWDHASSSFRRTQGNRHSFLRPRHRRRRQSHRTKPRSAHPVRLLGVYRQASLHRAALHGSARHRQLGLGHHHFYHHLQPCHAAHSVHDDAFLTEDDAHSA